MEDKNEEENLNTPINPQSENSPLEVSPTLNTETINTFQESENMEIHHHAHDPAAPHHKKNWKSYFWEFLMLFLAVFCGFLAETYHTHLVNKGIEKRNIERLINGIQKDVINLSASISKCQDKEKKINLLTKIPGNFSDTAFQKQFFKYALELLYIENYKPDESAFLQMQSSGTLRLIEKQNIADSILKYQSQNATIKTQMGNVNGNSSSANENLLQISDFRKSPLKFNGNSQQIQNYINYKIAEAFAINNYIFHLKIQLNTANNLIPFLKKEYNLE